MSILPKNLWRKAEYNIKTGTLYQKQGSSVWKGSPKGSPTGQSELKITYSVDGEMKDSGGDVTAKKTYVLYIHDPIEWDRSKFEDGGYYWDSVPAYKVYDGEASWTGSVRADFLTEDFYFDATKEAIKQGSTAASIIVAADSAGIGAGALLLAQTLGIVLDQQQPKSLISESGVFTSCWTFAFTDPKDAAANSTWRGGRPTLKDGTPDNRPEKMSKYKLTDPQLAVKYNVRGYDGKTFDTGGYTGDMKGWTAVKDGAYHVTGTFVPNTASDPDLPMPSALTQEVSSPSGGSS